jgi:hypothetical protein
MPTFRPYLLDGNDNIKAFEIVECPAELVDLFLFCSHDRAWPMPRTKSLT